DLRHGAGLLGTGSDVLGFDTPRSMDHHWGPRVWLYLRESDFSQHLAAEIHRVLADKLPFEIHGFPTHFVEIDPARHTVFMSFTDQRPINHMVFVTTARRFFNSYLGLDPLAHELSPAEWLSMPEQCLRTVTSGSVHRDDLDELRRAQALLRWYPHDVWLYVLAAQWRRIEQEEAFVGRCGEVGDDLGSRVVAARLVRELMHLCLLMEQQYAPYSKWFGTAFSRLRCAPDLTPHLSAVLAAGDSHECEQHLIPAYRKVAEMHNSLRLTPPLPTETSRFHDRPFQVLHGDVFADALRAEIHDPRVAAVRAHIGSLSQWADSTDILSYPSWYPVLRQSVYESAR
ncbi:MAG: DUF4037 domain-containing protein, partial [Chloroflexi bacterium]|nr:DUF4037 domain-containing protein [Chloroflexota bacterium]